MKKKIKGKNKKIRLGTLFSGIGAIEQAFKRMNIPHEIVFACDNGGIDLNIEYDLEFKKIKKLNNFEQKNEYVRNLYKNKTRKTNFVEISYLHNYNLNKNRFFNDVRLFDGTDFEGKIDILVGGSPCQSFSIIGKQCGLEDTRGTLFYEFARVVKESQPNVFIFENVYGMLNHDKGKTWEIVQNVFKELGYEFKWQLLDARNYNIPQGRRRVFIVGFKDKKKCNNFNFPKSIKLKYSMQDFLLDNIKEGGITYRNKDLILDKENGGQEIEEKYFLSEKLKKYVLSPGTKKFMHKSKIDLPIARALLATMGNTHRSSVNNYITTNGRIRALHPRETHRLMGFPDDYQIVVSKAQAYKQSGNSIVVDVLINILDEIMKTYYGEDKQ